LTGIGIARVRKIGADHSDGCHIIRRAIVTEIRVPIMTRGRTERPVRRAVFLDNPLAGCPNLWPCSVYGRERPAEPPEERH
jgi:hypothetical protein